MGQDPSTVTGKAKTQQLAAAKHLVQSGIGTDDAKRLYRWLAPQPWVVKGGGVDLKLMAGQAGKWTLQGKPDGPVMLAPGNETMVRAGGGTRVTPRAAPSAAEKERVRDLARRRMEQLSGDGPARSAGGR